LSDKSNLSEDLLAQMKDQMKDNRSQLFSDIKQGSSLIAE